jgi:hypothetical protein
MNGERIFGAFLFAEDWQPWTADQAVRQINDFAARGVNAVFTESETYRDDVIDAAHRAGLRWIGGIACFSDHVHQHQVLEQRPELWPIDASGARRAPLEWYVGVTPTFKDYAASRLALAERLVTQHPLDGFVLDFIRWPIHWELELRPGAARAPESSFDAHTLDRFQAESGIRLPSNLADTASQSRWIRAHAASEWLTFKCTVITDVVRECAMRLRAVRRQRLSLGVFTLPLPPAELATVAGQRLVDLAPLVDWVAPMAYHAILHRPTAWVSEIVEATAHAAPGQVLPVVQISSAEGSASGADWGPPVSTAEAGEVLHLATERIDSRGVVAFPGSAVTRVIR